jgi:hypothetical protein
MADLNWGSTSDMVGDSIGNKNRTTEKMGFGISIERVPCRGFYSLLRCFSKPIRKIISSLSVNDCKYFVKEMYFVFTSKNLYPIRNGLLRF